jgi:hypothetical protein
MRRWWRIWSMSRRTIRIERLEIRLKGVAPEAARAAAGHLGADLLGQLNELPALGGRRVVNISRLDAGTLRVSGASAPGLLRQQLARAVAATIRSKIQ